MCGILKKLLTSYHVLNLKFPSHSLKIKFFLAFSEINPEYQYSFFIFVRLSYMLNFDFLYCSVTDIYIYPLLRLVLHAQNHSSITIINKFNL